MTAWEFSGMFTLEQPDIKKKIAKYWYDFVVIEIKSNCISLLPFTIRLSLCYSDGSLNINLIVDYAKQGLSNLFHAKWFAGWYTSEHVF